MGRPLLPGVAVSGGTFEAALFVGTQQKRSLPFAVARCWALLLAPVGARRWSGRACRRCGVGGGGVHRWEAREAGGMGRVVGWGGFGALGLWNTTALGTALIEAGQAMKGLALKVSAGAL